MLLYYNIFYFKFRRKSDLVKIYVIIIKVSMKNKIWMNLEG